MQPDRNDCGPLDVLGAAALRAALHEPPLGTLKLAGPLGILLVIVALAAIVIAYRSDLRRVVRWIVICAAVEVLLGGAAMWFGAVSVAEVLRRLRTPTLGDVVAGANPVLATAVLGGALALFVLAQLLVVHLRRCAESGGSRHAPLLASIGLALAFSGGLVLLDARAHERIERESRERLERSRARSFKVGWALSEAQEGRGSEFGLGLKLFDEGDERGALVALDQAVAKSPTDSDALCWRGKVKFQLGDAAGATADFRAALTLEPRNDDARAHLSLLEPWKPRR